MKKLWFLLLAPLFFVGNFANASVSLIATTTASSTATATGTSATINTIGANFYVVNMVAIQGTLSGVSVSDNLGNTYTPLNAYNQSTNGVGTLYYSLNPQTSSTFNFSEKGNYSSAEFMAFSGVATSSPLDVQNGTGTISTIVNSGSVTPSVDLDLCVTGFGSRAGTSATSTAPFVVPYQLQVGFLGGNHMGSAISWYQQGSSTPINATWTNQASTNIIGYIGCFKSLSTTTTTTSTAPNANNINNPAFISSSLFYDVVYGIIIIIIFGVFLALFKNT